MPHFCLSCDTGAIMARFEDQTETIEHFGMSRTVGSLSGWRCPHCKEEEFDAESAVRYASAGDELVLADRRRQGQELRRIRKKLRLTQQQAAQITGGGHNAFSRYERGDVPPLPAVTNLFRLLDRHPDLLSEISSSAA